MAESGGIEPLSSLAHAGFRHQLPTFSRTLRRNLVYRLEYRLRKRKRDRIATSKVAPGCGVVKSFHGSIPNVLAQLGRRRETLSPGGQV